jgi:integrase
LTVKYNQSVLFVRKSVSFISAVYKKMNVHMVDSDSESDEMSNAPPDIADEKNLNLLPKKSGDLYKKQYSVFIQWCNEKKITEYNENVLLAFFSQKAEKYKSSTLWSTFSMLKATLIAKNNINIGSYPKLMAYLKRQNVGYKAKKSNVFTKSEINTFLLQAPDDTYLMCKVCLIFGLAGGCRRQELRDISIDNIEDRNDILLVKIPDAATGKWRIFAVTDKVCEGRSALEIYHKYVSLRPIYVTHKTFFISYRNGRCNNQVVGIHTFAKIPSIIAKYLNLPDTNNYTGHCFRKTAVSLANAGADIMTLKGQRGWRSSPVAERYVEDSPSNKLKMTNEILNDNKLLSQNRWTVTQLEALIAQYKTYPVLYSNNHQDRDNVDLKNQYLSQIVQALQSARPGVTAVDVLSQWNNLIIKYMQAARLQLQGPTGTEASENMRSQPALHFCRYRSPTCGTSKKWTFWNRRVWRT